MRADDLPPVDQDAPERNETAIRKGSVGAFLVNGKLWSDPGASVGDRAAAERVITQPLPALRALGLSAVLAIRDAEL